MRSAPFVCAVRRFPALAQVRQDKDLPQSGTLSTTVQTGRAANVAPGPFGFEELGKSEVSPITGSVSRAKPGEWVVKVFNNSPSDTYSVDVEVLQRNDREVVVKRDAFSYTLKPNSSKEQPVSEGVGVRGAELKLSKYSNLTAKRAKAPVPPASK